jgi:hypothetical protein
MRCANCGLGLDPQVGYRGGPGYQGGPISAPMVGYSTGDYTGDPGTYTTDPGSYTGDPGTLETPVDPFGNIITDIDKIIAGITTRPTSPGPGVLQPPPILGQPYSSVPGATPPAMSSNVLLLAGVGLLFLFMRKR